MARLRRIDQQTYLVILGPISISLLASLVAAVITRSSEFFVFILTTFFLLAFFGIIMSYQAGRLAERVENVLDRRLPEIKFIFGDEAALKWELLNIVQQARSYIAATGGRARIQEYLQAIETKVLDQQLRYTRVIPGDPQKDPAFAIRHELCQHLCKLLSHPDGRRLTTVIRTDAATIGYYTSTDAGFIIFMPNPRPKAPFDSCISMPGRPEMSDRYREYVVETLGGDNAERITEVRRVKELCRQCRQENPAEPRPS